MCIVSKYRCTTSFPVSGWLLRSVAPHKLWWCELANTTSLNDLIAESWGKQVIADLWDADRRGIALAIFSLAPFAGPAVAPIVSGALQVTGTDWRVSAHDFAIKLPGL